MLSLLILHIVLCSQVWTLFQKGFCGSFTGTCWCDEACIGNGDCCIDIALECRD